MVSFIFLFNLLPTVIITLLNDSLSKWVICWHRYSCILTAKKFDWRSIMGDKKQSDANLKGTFILVMALGIFIVVTWVLVLNLYLDRF